MNSTNRKIADACIEKGIRFIPFRNEQQASLAASVYGYLTSKPGVLLTVGGPGIVNALAGVYNANSNKWPLMVLAGSTKISLTGKGGFQELDQVSLMKPWAKSSFRTVLSSQIPQYLEKAYWSSIADVPGTTYVDLPDDLINQECYENVRVMKFDFSLLWTATPELRKIKRASKLLKDARFPLLIIGKGAANAAHTLRQFVATHQIAFLPTPMGKGIIPDASNCNVSSARSLVLKHADVVLVAGARLNWILHFGEPPKFNKDVKIIQIDTDASEIARSVGTLELGVLGDVGHTINHLSDQLKGHQFPALPKMVTELIEKREQALRQQEEIVNDDLMPSHTQALAAIRKHIPPDANIVAEGARTMDLSRQSLYLCEPRQRLDAGTNGTMGIGLAYAVTAKLTRKNKPLIVIQGDSAFGFSAMEIETLVRERLPCLIIVLNNSGIYNGVENPREYVPYTRKPLPSTALTFGVRYEKIGWSLGGTGYFVEKCKELDDVLEKGVEDMMSGKIVLINVLVKPHAKL
ncbi:hypothetical protein KL911_001180 [Ogataea haglerorum]|uniref:2-hydroxyacyl-CoA lyase n=1 Tax=Ogataea haglerorum TaxID=1937702 RepID=A0ABQ7RN97_9ASCO|nr:uncharacterized protein KL911_001180 [Ogataea haglerorum]KAG7701943.1 hypothetical protein KL951_000399 [Ogataea haglerorum]KAG7751208.1 hypothetical protein KL912_000341 [Ogataea haglerorum]KAG7756378.1 hypothetical protein KL911_001180 [Ogataea haglerorum]KAG7769083.1 hypothetical protein KL946_000366 [Ogataea haglerorum]KAG7772058.1 hypothetical protein KL931_000398 [Ogataea haglerorum]